MSSWWYGPLPMGAGGEAGAASSSTFSYKDRVMETSTTTGTGTLTLAGAITGYQSFAAIGNGGLCDIAIWAVDGNGVPTGQWEVTGPETYNYSGPTITRANLLASSTGALIDFSAGTKRVAVVIPADAIGAGIDTGEIGGRLTLESGTPVSTSDQTAKGTVYYAPYTHNRISLYTGARWKLHQFSQPSLSLTLTDATNYDVFMYDNSGTLTLELTAWTSATARATALIAQDGIWVKTGATTRRYLGTIRASGTNLCEDSISKRYVWNTYNQVARKLKVIDDTTVWTYATSAYRSYNNSTANRVSIVNGLPGGTMVQLSFEGQGYASAGSANACLGIGVDSVTVNGADLYGFTQDSASNTNMNSHLNHYPDIGYHYYQCLEYRRSTGTAAFRGSVDTPQQNGMIGIMMG